jgi:dihydrofolate reductase
MRKVIFGGGNSLDNFIARKDHAVDWLIWDDEVASISGENWQRYDAIVMGRKTYEASVRLGTTSYPNVENYVFSRTMKKSPDRNVKIISTDAAEFVRELKSRPGKDICVMGGGELAQSLFAADLIDEVGCNIHPVLLGSGVPLFHGQEQQIDLERIDCKILKNGCVYILYRVKHKDEGKRPRR